MTCPHFQRRGRGKKGVWQEAADPGPRPGIDLGAVRAVRRLAGRAHPTRSAKVRTVSFETGELIMRQGDAGSSLLVISDGHVEISTRDDGARHFIGRAAAGEVLGEMALLTGEPRTADAKALTPVRALAFGRRVSSA